MILKSGGKKKNNNKKKKNNHKKSKRSFHMEMERPNNKIFVNTFDQPSITVFEI